METPLSGSQRKVEIRYTPATPFTGVVIVRLRSRDLASPPHTFDREVTQFIISGTTFLSGDIDRDGRVDGVDLLVFAPTFGARKGDARYKGFSTTTASSTAKTWRPSPPTSARAPSDPPGIPLDKQAVR